jgi:hypothetical protein
MRDGKVTLGSESFLNIFNNRFYLELSESEADVLMQVLNGKQRTGHP